MRRWLIGLSMISTMAGCDKLGMGSGSEGSNSGPSMSDTATSASTSGGSDTDGLGTTGPGPGVTSGQSGATTSGGWTTGADTEGCGTEDTAADPWGDEDGCGGGLPTQSPYDVGDGGNCWHQSDRWNLSCEDEPCLDYDCQTPALCGSVTFGDCSPPSGTDSGDDGPETTGGPEVEVDDPAALECILAALRDGVPIRYTVTDCDSLDPPTTYEIVSNGLVIVTTEEVYGSRHWREQSISTFDAEYDYASCIGPGVEMWEKRWCLGKADNGGCPVGPVACPGE